MLTNMGAYTLAEWMAYYEAEPWGEDRADLRAGIIASTLANIHRGRDGHVFTPVDFMPYTKRAVEESYISDDEIERRVNNFMRRYH